MLPVLSTNENYHSFPQKQTNLMVFELSCSGHYPEYLAYLVRHWCEQQYRGCLCLVVSSQFLRQYQEIVNLPDNYDIDNIEFFAIAPEEEASWKNPHSPLNRVLRSFAEFELAQKYARKLKVDQVFFLNLDILQLPLALGKEFPCPFSGIYSYSGFHYHQFFHQDDNFSEQMEQLREKLILQRTLAHPQLEKLFSLDPFILPYLNRVRGVTRIVHLNDALEIDNPSLALNQKLKISLGVESGRLILLVFGSLTANKGILQILEALSLLSHQLCEHLCLLLVGSIADSFRLKVEREIEKVQSSLPVQIVTHYQDVERADIQNYFKFADVILALDQNHAGMSRLLVRAAAAQKPVLATNYGLIGELTRRYQLGLDLDSSDPQEIARALQYIGKHPPEELGDRAQMQRFAQQNSAQNFVNTIFEHL